ncbi:hypothetical protein GSY69_07415 [Brevibacterium sp. 5221]|uniref:Uncharacterized protein n=1 Tax=Brevibacterium rongguiense TaxID=2695267 RepID=A0A6N9H7D7_9MICO|nr:hypothetical protein [Brevibacterium rongguiense]MYM19801.1 hypothetical protein [Brevibacterium rongguiense]
MSDHAEKTKERILASPAPRDIEWTHFITMWENYADRVEQESGDRLAVDMNGHRQVFRRQHDGLVGIEDIEHARHLFAKHESTEGTGRLFVVTLTEEDARFYDFDLSAHDVEVDAHEHEKNPDSRGHHMRTVEKKTGRDDENDLKRFFDDLVADLNRDAAGRDFVLLGHGTGKSNAAQAFAEYLEKGSHPLHAHVVAVGDIDLSAAGEPEIEKKAQELAGR